MFQGFQTADAGSGAIASICHPRPKLYDKIIPIHILAGTRYSSKTQIRTSVTSVDVVFFSSVMLSHMPYPRTVSRISTKGWRVLFHWDSFQRLRPLRAIDQTETVDLDYKIIEKKGEGRVVNKSLFMCNETDARGIDLHRGKGENHQSGKLSQYFEASAMMVRLGNFHP